MTNQNKAIIPKHKYGVNYNNPDYFKTKNKVYYQTIKENPYRAKSSLINYYKKRYGDELVLNLIETFGLDEGLNQLRLYKNELKKIKICNPLLAINTEIECY